MIITSRYKTNSTQKNRPYGGRLSMEAIRIILTFLTIIIVSILFFNIIGKLGKIIGFDKIINCIKTKFLSNGRDEK